MNALKYKYQQGIQELIQDGMPASEITPYYQTIRRYNHKKLWRMIGIPICVISIIFVFVLTSINILKESLLEIWNKHQRQMSAVKAGKTVISWLSTNFSRKRTNGKWRTWIC